MTTERIGRLLVGTGMAHLALVMVCGSAQRATSGPPGEYAGQPLTVQVPGYGLGYTGQPGGFTPADVKTHLEQQGRIIELLTSIDAKVGAAAQAPPAEDPRLAVARKSCLGCHAPGTAEKKGDGFVLFTDDAGTAIRPLRTREANRLKEMVQNGDMPPADRRQLSAAEKSAFK